MMTDTHRLCDFNPLRVTVTVTLLAVLLALYGVLSYRAAVERIPETGRAVPIEELRAAWAEAAEDEIARRVSTTMPQSRPERRP